MSERDLSCDICHEPLVYCRGRWQTACNCGQHRDAIREHSYTLPDREYFEKTVDMYQN